MMRAALALALVAAAYAAPKCKMPSDAYPPALAPLRDGTAKNVTWVSVDLDADPTQRWQHVVAPYSRQISQLMDVIIRTVQEVLGQDRYRSLLASFDRRMTEYTTNLPGDYGKELGGIANATGLDPALVLLYNVFYTVFGACTSIVAQDGHGSIYHARNLDFGLWPALDLKNGSFWELATVLRPLVVNVNVHRSGKPIYSTTTYRGFVGLSTAVRPGSFSITLNTRFDDHLDAGLLRWLRDPAEAHVDSTLGLRHIMETVDSYPDALSAVTAAQFIGPAYVILGGVKPGEGAVLTKGAAGLLKPDGETVDVVLLADALKNGTSYVLQTNYDNWKPAPWFDNRRDPGKLCMDKLGPDGTGFAGLYNVLQGKPNLNRLTTFSTLMQVATGRLETYRQLCDTLDCPLF